MIKFQPKQGLEIIVDNLWQALEKKLALALENYDKYFLPQ
jgi:hypothetical protein